MIKFLYILIIFFSGFNLIAIELLFPRITSIWFGNILNIWAINFAMSLLVCALGYRLGSILISKKIKGFKIIILLFSLIFAHNLLISNYYQAILDSMLFMEETIATIIFSFLFLFPSIGLLTTITPLLVDEFNTTLKPASIFFISTLGGTISVLIIGIYVIPNYGIQFTFWFLALTILGLIAFLFFLYNVYDKK